MLPHSFDSRNESLVQLSRRDFFTASNAVPGILGTGASWFLGACGQVQRTSSTTAHATSDSLELHAINRLAYGPRPGDVEHIKQMGFHAYVEEQLNPQDQDTAILEDKLKTIKLHIEYEAGDDYPGLSEDRPLINLNKPLSELWKLVDPKKKMDWSERIRPAEEVRIATWLRAVYSNWQLREVLTEFWHNHFNVNAFVDERIAATWPLYDREIIRRNCFGNFRQFLEDVAKSTAMQYYLDNATSRASPANENYARELFELHTLGAEHYFNHFYNRWRNVPGALEGKPIGYIDQDIYEASRAFTGWTINDGTDSGRGEVFPDTGQFRYFEGWHDNYQKRILGIEFDPNQPPMMDGHKVLDLVAFHPGTAKHIASKLCRRFVCDNPPVNLIDTVSQVWITNQNAPDQIKQAVKAILLSDEFACSTAQKVKRPFELVASFLRATSADFTPNQNLIDSLAQMGYRQFDYPAPTGHPDTAEHWLGTNVMLWRWNVILRMFQEWFGVAVFNLEQQIPARLRTSREITTFWIKRLVGRSISRETFNTLVEFLAHGKGLDVSPGGTIDDVKQRLHDLVALICMTPEFQLR
ncbi:MAG: DUF1800 domain-containing protein [Candidatus Melainabacteria bacterium]|nr:DUF1800 domain-containing protein [Candidatus Melainabacteria bacterium]